MVSIHGPLGYGPSTLPLRHSARFRRPHTYHHKPLATITNNNSLTHTRQSFTHSFIPSLNQSTNQQTNKTTNPTNNQSISHSPNFSHTHTHTHTTILVSIHYIVPHTHSKPITPMTSTRLSILISTATSSWCRLRLIRPSFYLHVSFHNHSVH